MTPVHIFRGLQFEMIRYRYMKTELQLLDPNMNFFRFIKMIYRLENFSDFAKGYLPRIRLFAKRKRED